MISGPIREFVLRELDAAYKRGKRDGILIVAESLEGVLEAGRVTLGPGASAEDGFRTATELARSTLDLLGLEDDERG